MDLQANKQVYCLRRGIGYVYEVSGSLAYIKFGTKTIPYSLASLAEAGSVERSLFWHNPVIAPPPEKKEDWEALKAALLNIAKLLEKK